MKADVISFIQHLKMADEHMSSFIRDYKGTTGAILFARYQSKVKWMLNDLLAQPVFTQPVREGIRKEINSDVFAVPAIAEKIALLSPEQRSAVEDLIDTLLSGAELTVEHTP